MIFDQGVKSVLVRASYLIQLSFGLTAMLLLLSSLLAFLTKQIWLLILVLIVSSLFYLANGLIIRKYGGYHWTRTSIEKVERENCRWKLEVVIGIIFLILLIVLLYCWDSEVRINIF